MVAPQDGRGRGRARGNVVAALRHDLLQIERADAHVHLCMVEAGRRRWARRVRDACETRARCVRGACEEQARRRRRGEGAARLRALVEARQLAVARRQRAALDGVGLGADVAVEAHHQAAVGLGAAHHAPLQRPARLELDVGRVEAWHLVGGQRQRASSARGEAGTRLLGPRQASGRLGLRSGSSGSALRPRGHRVRRSSGVAGGQGGTFRPRVRQRGEQLARGPLEEVALPRLEGGNVVRLARLEQVLRHLLARLPRRAPRQRGGSPREPAPGAGARSGAR